MSVITSIEDTGPCLKRVTIEVPAPAVDAEAARVVNEFRRTVRIPGFRRGKVPQSVIKQRFHSDIEKELVDRLLPRYWHQASAEKDLKPLTEPVVEDLAVEMGQPMKIVVSVETRPEIALANLEGFELPSARTEPTEPEVDDAIEDLRISRSVWIDVERAAVRGDLISGSSSVEGGEPTPYEIEIGGRGADEEVSLAVTGLTAGKTTSLEASESRPALDLTVELVKERSLPDLTDEFATAVGKFEDLADLRATVVEDLRSHKQRELAQRREAAVLSELRTRHPLELPQRLVSNESENILRDYAAGLADQGVDVENAGIDWEALNKESRPRAEARVHDRLVLDAIVAEWKLEVDESEFEQLLAAIAQRQKLSSPALRQRLSETGRLEPLRAQILRQQAMRRILGTDAEDSEKPATDDSSAETD